MFQGIIKKGKVIPVEVPPPELEKGMVLIKVFYSCISAGTEMKEFAKSKKPLIQRALQQPDKVKKVFEVVRTEGFSVAYNKILSKLELGTEIGYSLSGIVISVGREVKKFKVGDRVCAAGVGYAHHAEYVTVPENLIVKVPDNLPLEHASTVALGSIALHSVRRASPQIGEYVVVFGAGIIGLITLQILIAGGVRTAVVDIDQRRLEIARDLGAELVLNSNDVDVVKGVINWSDGYGADVVIFTASTQDSEPLSQCFKITRRKGKVILVGVAGPEVKREDIYYKEIDFLVSTSYGPGRYDPDYEEGGIDYPYSYVRWTENRNMREYIRLLATGKIKIDKLIEKIFPIDKIAEAFESLSSNVPRPLIILLEYNSKEISPSAYLTQFRKRWEVANKYVKEGKINIAVVGTGNFATSVHLPNLAKLRDKFNIYAIVNRTGYKAKVYAEQYEAEYATTDIDTVLSDSEVDLVLITTRHDTHAELTLKSLQAGKNVFVEKPLAISREELAAIKHFYSANGRESPILFVGFNRRFSKYLTEIKKHTDVRTNPLFIHYRMNAGFLPSDHWIYKAGGRIIGEACHLVDTALFLTNSPVESVSVDSLSPSTEFYSSSDNKAMILRFGDGSLAIIEYFSVGHSELGKEYLEIHFDGKSIILDDYRNLRGYGIKLKEIKSRTPQKGHIEELIALYKSLSGSSEEWPIPLWQLLCTTEVCITLAEI